MVAVLEPNSAHAAELDRHGFVTILIPRQRLQLPRNGSRQSARFVLAPTTARIRLRIMRETPGGAIVLPAGSRLTTTLRVRGGDWDLFARGSLTGGVGWLSEYGLEWELPHGFFGDRGPQAIARRLGEHKGSIDVLAELLLDGEPIDTAWALESDELPAPAWRHHSSVAYDTVTTAAEDSGDGVVSLSHTASGTDRAVFMGTCNWRSPGRTSTSFTFAGNAATELWDLATADIAAAGYVLAGDASVPTGSQTATSTLSGSCDRQVIHVLSFTGVDGVSPTGTPSSVASTGSQSLDLGAVAADSALVDFVYSRGGEYTIGADQTLRGSTDFGTGSGGQRQRSTTQSGSAGGVMSFTLSNSSAVVYGAVELLAAGGGVATGRGRLVGGKLVGGNLVAVH